ncbi:Protein of unknown function [Gryllus bimaculatus]|nr:Protein of unknown function [Gryllus bimaculatus]
MFSIVYNALGEQGANKKKEEKEQRRRRGEKTKPMRSHGVKEKGNERVRGIREEGDEREYGGGLGRQQLLLEGVHGAQQRVAAALEQHGAGRGPSASAAQRQQPQGARRRLRVLHAARVEARPRGVGQLGVVVVGELGARRLAPDVGLHGARHALAQRAERRAAARALRRRRGRRRRGPAAPEQLPPQATPTLSYLSFNHAFKRIGTHGESARDDGRGEVVAVEDVVQVLLGHVRVVAQRRLHVGRRLQQRHAPRAQLRAQRGARHQRPPRPAPRRPQRAAGQRQLHQVPLRTRRCVTARPARRAPPPRHTHINHSHKNITTFLHIVEITLTQKEPFIINNQNFFIYHKKILRYQKVRIQRDLNSPIVEYATS